MQTQKRIHNHPQRGKGGIQDICRMPKRLIHLAAFFTFVEVAAQMLRVFRIECLQLFFSNNRTSWATTSNGPSAASSLFCML
eukprot:4276840-Amphidinium_carterae.1